jgi:hypothetical protein
MLCRLTGCSARRATWIFLLLLVLVSLPVSAAHTTIWNNGNSDNRVDVVFLGDGYTASQLGTLYTQHIDSMLDHMFFEGEDPFPRYRNFFNVHRVDLVSNQSGADIPPLGVFRDTALDSRYYFDGETDRLLYVNDAKALTVMFNEFRNGPFAPEMRIVTVNSTRYGGGGGAFAVYAGGNHSAPEVALHELGHSFSGLADEYGGRPGAYPGIEPIEPNITTDPTGQKWEQWLGYNQPGVGVIGAYEGGGYYDQGVYRPSLDSKMRSLGSPFDAVSREQIILDIYEYVDPLDAWLPNAAVVDGDDPLWVDVVDPDVIEVSWYVDGKLIKAAHGEAFSLRDHGFGNGQYQVTALAQDDTDWVRIRRDELQQSICWNVQIVPEPQTAILFALASVGVWWTRRQNRG